MGLLPRSGRPDLPFSGRLDRLVATDDGISIVDFKLGAKPDSPARAHVVQLALYRAALQPLYPGVAITAALVYLDGPTLAPVGDEELVAELGLSQRRPEQLSILCKSHFPPANPQGSNGLAALMRSHLLAKFARDGERNASGRAPRFIVDWSQQAWAGAARQSRAFGCRGRRRHAARGGQFCG